VSAQAARSGATLYLAGMPTRNQDGTWTVVFGLQRADGILGLDMNLHFDSEAIHIVGVTTSGIGSAWTSAGHENGSDYQIALFGVEALRGTGPFLKVTYTMTRPVDGVPFGIAAQANEGQIPISWTGVPRATAPEVHVDVE